MTTTPADAKRLEAARADLVFEQRLFDLLQLAFNAGVAAANIYDPAKHITREHAFNEAFWDWYRAHAEDEAVEIASREDLQAIIERHNAVLEAARKVHRTIHGTADRVNAFEDLGEALRSIDKEQ